MVKVRKPLSTSHMEYASIRMMDVCTCVIVRTMQSEEWACKVFIILNIPTPLLSFWFTTISAGDVTTFVHSNTLERTSMASEETLNSPSGIVMNQKENVFFVANDGNHTILKITSSGMSIHHSSLIIIVLTHLSRDCECVCWKWAYGRRWWSWQKSKLRTP